MAFINSLVLILVLLLGVVDVVVVPVIISVVVAGTLGASAAPSVEGAVVTGGITSGGSEVDSPCFSFRAFSSAYSVSVNLSLSFMSNSIMSSSDFCCTTSVV